MEDKDLEYVTSGFGARTFNRLIRAQRRNRVIPGLGWTQTPDGLLPPYITEGGAVSTTLTPWRLNPEGDDVFSIITGDILTGENSLTDVLTNDTPSFTFEPAAGDIVYIEFSGLEPTSYSIKSGSTWPGDDSSKPFSFTGSPASFEKGYFPLFKFYEVTGDNRKKVSENLYAKRLAPESHLQVSQALVKTSDDDYILAATLEAGFGAIS